MPCSTARSMWGTLSTMRRKFSHDRWFFASKGKKWSYVSGHEMQKELQRFVTSIYSWSGMGGVAVRSFSSMISIKSRF